MMPADLAGIAVLMKYPDELWSQAHFHICAQNIQSCFYLTLVCLKQVKHTSSSGFDVSHVHSLANHQKSVNCIRFSPTGETQRCFNGHLHAIFNTFAERLTLLDIKEPDQLQVLILYQLGTAGK